MTWTRVPLLPTSALSSSRASFAYCICWVTVKLLLAIRASVFAMKESVVCVPKEGRRWKKKLEIIREACRGNTSCELRNHLLIEDFRWRTTSTPNLPTPMKPNVYALPLPLPLLLEGDAQGEVPNGTNECS